MLPEIAETSINPFVSPRDPSRSKKMSLKKSLAATERRRYQNELKTRNQQDFNQSYPQMDAVGGQDIITHDQMYTDKP